MTTTNPTETDLIDAIKCFLPNPRSAETGYGHSGQVVEHTGGNEPLRCVHHAATEVHAHVDPCAGAHEGVLLQREGRERNTAHSTAGAGYLPNVDGLELPVRQTGRVRSEADIAGTIVRYKDGHPVTIGQVAEVVRGATPKRGNATEGGKAAVVLSVQKSPGTNTLNLTDAIDRNLDQVEQAMPPGVVLNRYVMRQSRPCPSRATWPTSTPRWRRRPSCACWPARRPTRRPVVMNTCYSFVDSKNVIHVASVHQYDADKKVVLPVPGAGGVSMAANELEGKFALAWAKNIWADRLV